MTASEFVGVVVEAPCARGADLVCRVRVVFRPGYVGLHFQYGIDEGWYALGHSYSHRRLLDQLRSGEVPDFRSMVATYSRGRADAGLPMVAVSSPEDFPSKTDEARQLLLDRCMPPDRLMARNAGALFV